MPHTAPRTILVVEDNDEDFAALQRVFNPLQLAYPIQRFADGDDCLDYLQRCTHASTEPLPALILLDLNLPGTDGRDVLDQIKRDPTLKIIPITILTTSTNPRDVEACYRNGANSYIQKSMNFASFQKTIHSLVNYWLGAVTLPAAQDRP